MLLYKSSFLSLATTRDHIMWFNKAYEIHSFIYIKSQSIYWAKFQGNRMTQGTKFIYMARFYCGIVCLFFSITNCKILFGLWQSEYIESH